MSDELGPLVRRFVEQKRALARKYHSEEKELTLLVVFAEANGIRHVDQVTPAVLDDFLGSRPRQRPRSFNHLLGAVRCFFDWLVAQNLLADSPLRAHRRRVTTARIPFIFDVRQARLLLAAAAALPDNSRAQQRGCTYRALFALCYGLGLRAGEACGLRLGDVDSDRNLLVVRGGKFGKSRLVPHGRNIAALVAAQVERQRCVQADADANTPLFTFDGHRPVHPGTASQTFHYLIPSLALPWGYPDTADNDTMRHERPRLTRWTDNPHIRPD
jgi:site-specific recombinase XerD